MVTYDPSSGTANVSQYVKPRYRMSMHTAGAGNNAVLQDISQPTGGTIFATQHGNGSNGTDVPGDIIINRVDIASGGDVLDFMRLVDAGHGLGVEVEGTAATGFWVSLSWYNKDYIKFPYKPGVFTRAQVQALSGFYVYAFFQSPGDYIKWDRKTGYVAVRHNNPGGSPDSETYTRRKLSEMQAGIDKVYGAQITLPFNPPILQGFATINNTLFRWNGARFDQNNVPTDPASATILEQYDWNTGKLIGSKTFNKTVAEAVNSNGTEVKNGVTEPTWRDGRFEAEGACMYKEADGTVSLLVGDSTGALLSETIWTGASGSGHAWHFSSFDSIGN